MINQLENIMARPFLTRALLTVIALLAFTTHVSAGTENIILAFGDSITVGKGVYNESPGDGVLDGGYEPYLTTILTDARHTFEVKNYGVSGESVIGLTGDDGGDLRIQEVVDANLTAKYILILQGTNDLYHGANTPEDVIAALEGMIKYCNNKKVTPILSTLTPDETAGKGEDKDIEGFNTLLKEMAADNNVVIIDPYTVMKDDWISTYALGYTNGSFDYLHMNATG